jgi:hypothetical protein
MKNYDKRKEAGKMFIDVGKYVLTVAVIGKVFSEQFNMQLLFFAILFFLFCFFLGIYLIPPNKN